MIDRTSLRLWATLLLVGQLLYIVVTQFHTGGDANDHPAIFAAYAGSGIWTAVHFGQFAGMALLLAGLLALFFALDVQAGTARWAGRFGAASAVAALGLVGGPLLCASGIAVLFGVLRFAGTGQGIASIPEFLWELALGVYLAVKGFRPSPVASAYDRDVGRDGDRPPGGVRARPA